MRGVVFQGLWRLVGLLRKLGHFLFRLEQRLDKWLWVHGGDNSWRIKK